MSPTVPNTRQETDSLGEVKLPVDALYGSNTSRALDNFPFADRVLGDEKAFVQALAQLKKACALANVELGVIKPEVGDAIVAACDDMFAGKLDRHLVVPILEGSGGTSTNMNVNEVIANRALQLIGMKPGDYNSIHPNDHVNCGQSTNDIIPCALKLACFSLAETTVANCRHLAGILAGKSETFSEVYRLGRTCLQDAQPMTLQQAFEGYASVVARGAERIEAQRQRLLAIPLGGTAIGTGLGAVPGFQSVVFRHLCEVTGLIVEPSSCRFDGMQNLDELQRLSAELETLSGAMAKIAKDFILLSSGPNGGLAEIILPSVQPGSSIMPGKVNPVLPMAVVQLAQIVHGNHACVTMACQDGMLEINHYEHAVASRLFDSLQRCAETALVFADRCVAGIEADAERSMVNLMNSFALATTLVPRLGYGAVSKLVKDSVHVGRPFLELAEEQNLIARSEVLEIIKTSISLD